MTPKQGLVDLTGRNCVVTGGLGVIGRGIVRALAGCGGKVMIVDTSEERWTALKTEIGGTFDPELAFHEADVAVPEKIADTVAECDAAIGGADVWVNCAYPRTGDWGDGPESASAENWTENVGMQMTSTCLVSNEIAKRMAGRGSGSLVSIASIYGVIAPDFLIYEGTDMTMPPAYSAIKGGIIAYSRYLASYWGSKGVRVNAVCPGGIFADQPTSFVEAYCKRTPLGRMAAPADIAGPVAFLASDAAGYITGTTLMIDGGLSAL